MNVMESDDLPRQARDKCKETVKRTAVFRTCSTVGFDFRRRDIRLPRHPRCSTIMSEM